MSHKKHQKYLRATLFPVIALAVIISIFFQINSEDSESASIEVLKEAVDGRLHIEDSINLEELYKNALSFKLKEAEDQSMDIWFHDGAGLTINKFSLEGRHVNSIVLPPINEPVGLNRVSDFFVYNKDSIFVYDAQYRRLLLTNEKSDVLNLWLINNYIPELSAGRNNEIIDVYKNEKNELKIDLTGYSNIYYQSDPNFFRKNSLVYQINLSTEQVSRGLPYPEKSPYLDHLFWSGVMPYVRKAENGYLAVFPLDEKIYRYDLALAFKDVIDSKPNNFPRAIGNKYGNPQEMNFARIDRKLNGFNLKTRGVFNTHNEQVFAKIYRAPLGDHDEIPDDYASFLMGDYPSKHYLQVFKVEGDSFVKKYSDIEISRLGLGNLLHIDGAGRYYFLKNDPESEANVIVICRPGPDNKQIAYAD
ncbi:MAG: hypothetical protein HEP71_26445 [Roseivirga sp.]|nr:hypothetical protein [Roseivirga sp.]